MTEDDRVDSITREVRTMKPKRYTVRDAAALVNRSTDTLRRWRQSGLFVPSDKRQFGSTVVHLYTADDLKALRKIAKEQRSGPKPKAPNQPPVKKAAKKAVKKAVVKKTIGGSRASSKKAVKKSLVGKARVGKAVKKRSTVG